MVTGGGGYSLKNWCIFITLLAVMLKNVIWRKREGGCRVDLRLGSQLTQRLLSHRDYRD